MSEGRTNRMRCALAFLAVMVGISLSGTSVLALDLDPDYLFHSELTQQSGLDQPCGTATDSQGFLYIANPEREAPQNGEVKIFDAQGHFVTGFDNEHEPCKLAVDSSGNVYVVEHEALQVSGKSISVAVRYEPDSFPVTTSTTYAVGAEFESIQQEPGQPSDPCAAIQAVAVDPSNDHVYIGQPCAVKEYGSAAEGTPANPLLQRS